MKSVFFTLSLLVASLFLSAQYVSGIMVPDTSKEPITDTSDISVMLANSIMSKDMRKHLTILASDEYEGRETGQKGNDMAASYIANHFKSLNLPTIGEDNTYYQKVSFNRTGWKKNSISINGKEYKHLWDYLAFASLNETIPYLETEEIVYMGYGIDDSKYSDYKGKNVQDKVILINEGEPYNRDSISYITGSSVASQWTEDIYTKLRVAKSKGAKMVLIISSNLKGFLGENRRFLLNPRLQLGDGNYKTDFANHAYISTTMAKELIGSKSRKIKRWRKKNIKKGKSKKLTLKSNLVMTFDKNIEVIRGNNVLGYIEGTDKKDEVVVISAHYDHLGKTGNDIYNGADDNGSGTTTVLEMAQAFALAKDMGVGPRRSVLCLLVTGEEKGLLGSEFYSENPLFNIENTVVNVNIDMVGRVDKKYETNPNYIYVIGSDRLSSDLHKINEDINQKYSHITLDYQYNSEQDPNRYYYRSDHYNFARKGIPAIFYFNGTHEDYHRITDTVEKINFDKMEKVGRHFFHTAWELANREDRIVVDGVIEEGGR